MSPPRASAEQVATSGKPLEILKDQKKWEPPLPPPPPPPHRGPLPAQGESMELPPPPPPRRYPLPPMSQLSVWKNIFGRSVGQLMDVFVNVNFNVNVNVNVNVNDNVNVS